MQLITSVPAWPYGRKLFWTEFDAVKAHLADIADDIKRNHSSDPLTGMVQHAADLAPLLLRYADLEGSESIPAEDDFIMDEAAVVANEVRIRETVRQMRDMGSPAKRWLERNGFSNAREFADRAEDPDFATWARFMAGEPETLEEAA